MTKEAKTTMQKKLNPATIALVLALGVAPQAVLAQQSDELPTVTLQEAVELAQRASPAVVQSAGAVRNAEAGERTALGAFLPNVSLSSGASRNSTERFNPQTNTTVSGSSDSYNAGVSASVDLFTGGRRFAERRQARAETSAAEAGLIESRFAAALAAKIAFFNVLRSEELMRAGEARVRRAQEGQEAADRRLSVGSATRSDVLRTQLELNQARQALLDARNQRRSATFALGRVVGADGAVGARLEQPLEVRPLALGDAELLALVRGESPMVQAAEASVRAADAAVSAARTQYLPTLRLSTGSDWFNQEPTLDNGRGSWGMRLSASYPLFNGFQREATVERARVQETVAEARLEDARRAARAEVERLLGALRLAEEQLGLAEEAVRVAQEDLRVQEERYRLGAATILDRITSQVALVEAERALVDSRYDYQLARAELEALAGREL